MNYKILYASGCSFTKHQPIPQDETWPAHLGKLLNIESITNDGQGCGSNQRILRKLTYYINSRPIKEIQETLFIIQLSFPFRFEVNDNDEWTQCNENNFVSTSGTGDKDHALELIRLLKKYHSNERDDIRFLQQASAIESVFKHYKIKNYFFISICRMLDKKLKSIVDSQISWLNETSDKSWINSIKYDVISDLDLHPSSTGNLQIAQWIANGIRNDK